MSAVELGALLADASQAGAYFVDVRDREALIEAGGTLKFSVLPVDLRGCDHAQTALLSIAEVLRFPDWFGENLDALSDCLNDLSWLPAEGYVMVLEHAEDWRAREPDTFDAAVEIFNETAARWAEMRVPFWAFVPLPAKLLEEIAA
ncbi:MAG: hypothetical protein E6Q88_00770 [Lysobacteraceae bacterium]|nr:MAG: hypothetical protein E6Q88_00770 [Xanthomonadaceae bacterium]